jgi:hypothetical protein
MEQEPRIAADAPDRPFKRVKPALSYHEHFKRCQRNAFRRKEMKVSSPFDSAKDMKKALDKLLDDHRDCLPT